MFWSWAFGIWPWSLYLELCTLCFLADRPQGQSYKAQRTKYKDPKPVFSKD
jgi:hypothetical protein